MHDGNEDLAQRDKDCVSAAKGFRLKQNSNDPKRIQQRVKNIHATVNRAGNLEDIDDAIELYRSLISLHGDENWGDQESLREDLLADIEQRIKTLETEGE